MGCALPLIILLLEYEIFDTCDVCYYLFSLFMQNSSFTTDQNYHLHLCYWLGEGKLIVLWHNRHRRKHMGYARVNK